MAIEHSLVEQHIHLFNQGVASKDFSPMLAQFADDAELIFEGIAVGPFTGKAAIAAAYERQPPTDAIDVLAVHGAGPDIHVHYSWRSTPRQHAGTMIITVDGDTMTRLRIVYGGNLPGACMERGTA